MKISERNVYKGIIKKITPGAVNYEVKIALPGGLEITSIITKGSVLYFRKNLRNSGHCCAPKFTFNVCTANYSYHMD